VIRAGELAEVKARALDAAPRHRGHAPRHLVL
jgi:hypothetical protein